MSHCILPTPPRRRRIPLPILLVPLLLSTLACITFTTSVQVSADPAGDGQVRVGVAGALTEEYLAVARRLNAEAEDGESAPEVLDPEIVDMFTAQGFTVVEQSDTAFRAEKEYQLSPQTGDGVSFGELGEVAWNIDTETIDDGTLRTTATMTIPVYPFLDIVADEGTGEGGGTGAGPADPLGALIAALGAMGEELSPDGDVEAQVREILEETGMPVLRYEITLPGTIHTHTVNGAPGGAVEGNTFTLVLDEDGVSQYGIGPYEVVVAAGANPCAAACSGEHLEWDGMSSYPNCSCRCEQGWEANAVGDCVACEEVCRGAHPDAFYDPAATTPNSCGCGCSGPLQEFAVGEGAGTCRCVAGAEATDTGCRCMDGWTPTTAGDACTEVVAAEADTGPRLKPLIDRYMTTIPTSPAGELYLRGEFDADLLSVGAWNNIYTLSREHNYLWDNYVCGAYQDMVLDFLAQIQKEEPALLRGYEFGPIHIWYGGHQAVVLYRTGSDWRETGIVLDPWIYQTPESFNIREWSAMFGNTGGPAHSGVYAANGQYPHLSGGEPAYPGVPVPHNRPHHSQRLVVRSPVNLLVVAADGRRSGRLADGTILHEIDEIALLAMPLADGHNGWYVGLPNGAYVVEISGYETGSFHLTTADETNGILDYGPQPIVSGETAALTLDSAGTGELTLPDGRVVNPVPAEGLSVDAQMGEDAGGSIVLLLVCCCCLLLLAAAGGLTGLFILRRSRARRPA